MEIFINPVDNYTNDEQKRYKMYLSEGLDKIDSVHKVLQESLDQLFDRSFMYIEKVPFQGISEEDAFDYLIASLSKFRSSPVKNDKENLFYQQMSTLKNENIGFLGRLGIDARIVKNDPSYAHIKYGFKYDVSDPQDEAAELRIVNNITEEFIQDIGPAYVDPSAARSVDTQLNINSIEQMMSSVLDKRLGSLEAKMDIALSELLGSRLITKFYIDKGGFEKDTGLYVVKKGKTFQGVIEIEPVKEAFELVGLYSTMKIKKLIGEYKGYDPKDLEGIVIKPGKKETIEFKLKSPKEERSVILGLLGFLNINGEKCSAEPRTEPITAKPGNPAGQKLLHYGKKYGLKFVPVVKKFIK